MSGSIGIAALRIAARARLNRADKFLDNNAGVISSCLCVAAGVRMADLFKDIDQKAPHNTMPVALDLVRLTGHFFARDVVRPLCEAASGLVSDGKHRRPGG